MRFIKQNIFLIALILFSFGVLAVNLKINFFRYNNFDFGKFDLGNMTQMVWNTLHGRFLYLTDYFGTNLPRWAMSHVDPILVMFVPIFALIPHAMTLVVAQLVLVIFSSIIVYKIALLKLDSKFAAFLLGLAYLFYPAVGYLTAWTGFHGVTVVIPFFLGAFYVFEKMYKENNFTTKGLALFWGLLALTMMGKEQLPLYVLVYGVFVWLFRGKKKLGLSMMAVGFLWFFAAFFIIIPKYAHLRANGYARFAESIGLNTSLTNDVAKPNYFISRYEEFGDSYGEVMFGMLTHPGQVVRVFFGGDKLDNLAKTFVPVGLLPLLSPTLLAIAIPDFLINYLTTAGGIGTSEIVNHRVSMIVPVMFIATIYAVSSLAALAKTKRYFAILALSFAVLGCNIYTTFAYNNPIYLWLTQAIEKRLHIKIAHAKYDTETASVKDLEVGTVVRLSPLENKDRECAEKVVKTIPSDASVSGPDYLGAHLAQRETYAIFPALYNEADYVIVDVFSRKILTILDADVNLVRDVVGDMVRNEDYKLDMGCGNLFVFKKVGPHGKDKLLPLQEKFEYAEQVDLEIFQGLTVVDFKLPEKISRGVPGKVNLVYTKRTSTSLDGYFLFMTFVNETTGEIYQVANLPSFGITQPREWDENHYYIEHLEVAVPKFVDPGTYRAFIGMSNIIRTRSLYLGDIKVL